MKSQELKDQMMSENLKVAVLGLGNVGQNFIRILSDSAVHIRESCGSDIEIAFVADSTGIVKVDPGRTYANILLAKRAQNIQSLGEPATIEQVLDSGIDAIIDVSSASKDGNRELEIFRAAIDKGINIVTANKSPSDANAERSTSGIPEYFMSFRLYPLSNSAFARITVFLAPSRPDVSSV